MVHHDKECIDLKFHTISNQCKTGKGNLNT